MLLPSYHGWIDYMKKTSTPTINTKLQKPQTADDSRFLPADADTSQVMRPEEECKVRAPRAKASTSTYGAPVNYRKLPSWWVAWRHLPCQAIGLERLGLDLMPTVAHWHLCLGHKLPPYAETWPEIALPVAKETRHSAVLRTYTKL